MVHDALANAGCVDIETASIDEAIDLITTRRTCLPDLVVVNVHTANVPRLHRLAAADRDLPIVVICDEHDIDAVHLAGATEAVTTPLRARELLGRIRCALRERTEDSGAIRDRRMSD